MPTPTSRATEPAGIRRRRDRDGGFTLIEVVLALAIISLLAALALPSARPGAGTALLRVKASEIVALLRADRNVALQTGRAVVTRVDLANLRVEAGGSSGVLALPEGVPVRSSPASLDGIRFSGDGRSSGGRIELGREGRGLMVSINPLTAAIQVEGF